MPLLERLFHLAERQTTPRAELTGGLVTFLTMAYIIFVNPAVLSQTGMSFGAVLTATCLSAALATLAMGLLANLPIALAPAMGENFFFVGVVLGMGLPWPAALAAVAVSGLLFLGLNLVGLRRLLMEAIPPALAQAIAAGIGLLVVFVGLVNAGIVVRHPHSSLVPVALGPVNNPAVWVSLAGLLVTAALMVRRVPGALLLGILGSAGLALALGVARFQGLVSAPPSLGPTLLKLDLAALARPGIWPVVLVFLYMAVLDATGTLLGVGERAGLVENGRLRGSSRALSVDAAATVAGATLGTSTVTAYIESAAGVAAGARTGLSNLVVAALFLVAPFFAPLIGTIGGGHEWKKGVFLYPVTAPALILVGCTMAQALRRIPWDDLDESVPALLIVVGIPLTYSIADGLALGFVAYPVIKLLAGRGRQVPWPIYGLALVLLLRYALLRAG